MVSKREAQNNFKDTSKTNVSISPKAVNYIDSFIYRSKISN